MVKSIWTDDTKTYNIGFSVLVVLGTVFATIFIIYLWGYFGATQKVKYITDQAVALQYKVVEIEKENINLKERLSVLSKPFHLGDKLIYQNVMHGFKVELPGDYEISEQTEEILTAISSTGRTINIKTENTPLDALQHVTYPDSYVWQYSKRNELWIQRFGNNAPPETAPQRFFNKAGAKIYRADVPKEESPSKIAYVDIADGKGIIFITVSGDEPGSDENEKIMVELLSSIEFLNEE